ncbi:MAG: DUF1805 domain-containing protein [Hadesarchaea archaeon]|nr:DUF1805 domain-containing protein [Hadesarchaea archaeon]
MIQEREVRVGERKALGIRVELPEAPLLLLVAPKGYVMCGYLNVETAERLGQAAAVVTGVRSLEEMLEARVTRATKKARELGIEEGMSGREALKLMF